MMNSGFSEFLRAAPRDRRTCSLAQHLDSVRPNRTSKKNSGLPGHSMYCSMVYPLAILVFCLRAELRYRKRMG